VQEEWCFPLKQIKIQTQLTSFLSSKRGGVKSLNRFLGREEKYMKILAIAKIFESTTVEKIRPYMIEEVKQAWNLYKEGIIQEMYSCKEQKMGVVFILECESVKKAKVALGELPFVRENLIDFEYIPLGPFTFFEALFKEEQGE